MMTREARYEQAGQRDGAGAHGQLTVMLPVMRRALGDVLGLPEDEAVAHTLACYRQRLAALPTPAQHPELRGMGDCVRAYNRGMAQGAGISLQDVMLLANYRYMIHRRVLTPACASTQPEPGAGCTLVYFPHSERGPLLANNNDGTIDHAHQQSPPWIVCNQAGLIAATVSSGVFEDEPSPEQFPVPVFLLAAELCGTAEEGVDLLTRLCGFWEACNTLVADRRGRAAVIEKSNRRWAVRWSEDGFAATTEMAAEDPTYAEYLWQTRRRSLAVRGLDESCADWAYWRAAAARSRRLLGLLDDARAEPSFAGLERIIYDHIDAPEQVHMDGSLCHPQQEHGEWSLRTTVWVLEEQQAQYSFAQPPLSGHLTPRHWCSYRPVDYIF